MNISRSAGIQLVNCAVHPKPHRSSISRTGVLFIASWFNGSRRFESLDGRLQFLLPHDGKYFCFHYSDKRKTGDT